MELRPSKQHKQWLWHAIAHQTGQILANVLADHKDSAFIELKSLLEPFEIQTFYTDCWGVDERNLGEEEHVISKSKTQKIERKHLNLRTRLCAVSKAGQSVSLSRC